MPPTVAESLALDDLLIDVEATSKKHILELLSEHLASHVAELDRDAVFEALIERERLGCTAADFGLAMPHARLKTATAPQGVFMRLTNAIDFDSPDVADIDLVFCFVLPVETTNSHDEGLRTLTARLMSETVCRDLRAANDSGHILRILRECAEDLPHASGAAG